jgi:hypothetical protein
MLDINSTLIFCDFFNQISNYSLIVFNCIFFILIFLFIKNKKKQNTVCICYLFLLLIIIFKITLAEVNKFYILKK